MQVFLGKKWSSWMVIMMVFAGVKIVKSQAISPSYRMRALTVNNGLPQGWITDITQDSKGYIWMVASGLIRYDGRTFQSYHHREGDSGSLLSNAPLTIQTGDSENFLIVYNAPDARLPIRPVDLFNITTGKARHLSSEPAFRWMQQFDNIVYATQAGGRYFVGSSRELITFDLATGHHQVIALPDGEEIMSLGEDSHRQIWIATTKHLCKLQNVSLVPIAPMPVPATINLSTDSTTIGHRFHVQKLFEDAAGNIVMLGLNCVFAYQITTGNTKVLPLPLSNQIPIGLIKAKDGQFFFLAAGNIWQLGKNAFQSTLAEKVTGETFAESLLSDQSGTVWAIKQNATGLRLYNFQPANFHSYPYKNGFSHDVLEPWLHNTISYLDNGSYGTRIAKDQAGNVWVLNYRLRRINGKPIDTATIYRLTATGAIPFSYGGYTPRQLAFDRYNRLWIIHADSAFYIDKANPATGTFERFAQYPIEADNQYNGYITCTNDKVCVIEGNRLRVYDARTRACAVYTGSQMGFEKTMLAAVADPNDEQQLWISSQGSGITKLNLQTGKTEHLTEADGLLNNTVYMMVPDRKGYFWCSSNKGLFRFNPTDHSIVSFGVEDGLPGNEFNRFHFIETPDGHFVFGGTEGYTVFHSDSVYIDDYKPAALISTMLINNQPLSSVVPQLRDSIISQLNKIELPYNQNFLSFSFSALQFSNPQKIRYRYHLEGIDKDWVIAGPEATVGYTFLPPDTYRFRLNASNTDGIWSNQITTLKIIILPPWWKTGWAYLLYLLAACSLIYGLYRAGLRRAQTRQRLILQQKEAEQLRAVDEMKSRFFSNITHEFRTPLSLITAPLEEMQRQGVPAELKPKLQGVQRNAVQLLHLINQLLDMAKLEANSMPVDLRRGQLVGFVEDICNSFLPQATMKNIDLSFTNNLPDEECLFDGDKLQKIVANLLSNALKFTPRQGQVSVFLQAEKTKSDKKLLQITVVDTGIGIPAEKLPYIFNRFYQVDDGRTKAYEGTGIGLALVKELTDLLGGNIRANNNSIGTGSTFILMLPLLFATGTEESTIAIPAMQNQAWQQTDAMPAFLPDTVDKPLLLITEDNAELNAFIAAGFEKEYRVLTASNGKTGLETATRELPDIIISDARMPEMDGFSFCQAIKQNPETSHIAFVLLTAKATQQSRIEGLQSQADDYITKPFHVEELRLRIRNVLQRQQQLRLYYNRQLMVPEEALAPAQQQDPFLEQLYIYLEENLDEPKLTVEKMAAAVQVSQRTLTRKLNTIAGISGVELIKQYRLKKAAGFLLNGSTVAETAFATGYDNANYFSTAFKGFYGVSPTEYVKTNSKQ